MAGETLAKRYGRTQHAIFLLAQCGLLPLQSGQVPGMVPGSEEEAGFIAQRLTFYKDMVRTIFRTDTTSPVYPVLNHAFAVTSRHGTIHVIPGVMKQIGLSTFPHQTSVFVYGPRGDVLQQYHNAGNPQIG